jgi:hypothetical protein
MPTCLQAHVTHLAYAQGRYNLQHTRAAGRGRALYGVSEI